jgi:hypothetical protein
LPGFLQLQPNLLALHAAYPDGHERPILVLST